MVSLSIVCILVLIPPVVLSSQDVSDMHKRNCGPSSGSDCFPPPPSSQQEHFRVKRYVRPKPPKRTTESTTAAPESPSTAGSPSALTSTMPTTSAPDPVATTQLRSTTVTEQMTTLIETKSTTMLTTQRTTEAEVVTTKATKADAKPVSEAETATGTEQTDITTTEGSSTAGDRQTELSSEMPTTIIPTTTDFSNDIVTDEEGIELGHSKLRRKSYCTDPLDKGNGDKRRYAYFFNSTSNSCSSFIFSGLGGNKNKFSSLLNCKEDCIPQEYHALDLQRSLPPEAIPKSKADCMLPVVTGSGKRGLAFQMWASMGKAGPCEAFNYTGEGGNANRFFTLMDCQKLCMLDNPAYLNGWVETYRREENYDLEGQYQIAVALRKLDKEVAKQLVSKIPDSVGQYAPQAVQVASESERFDVPTMAPTTRDPDFVTWELEPNKTRDATLPARCATPLDRGQCTMDLRMWYFDQKESRCRDFMYSGCEGNANRFDSASECRFHCNRKLKSESAEMHRIRMEKRVVSELDCWSPPDVGPCLGSFDMWYYDQFDRSCRSFTHGGCFGNNNKYDSKRDCWQTCARRTASKEAADEEEPFAT